VQSLQITLNLFPYYGNVNEQIAAGDRKPVAGNWESVRLRHMIFVLIYREISQDRFKKWG